ncbi:hypothetical protein HK096_009241, partial [Nowakowskiella sp. JEL0078]
LGLTAPSFSKDYLSLLSTAIFLPLVKLLIFPLIFSILVVGIAGHGKSVSEVQRIGFKAVFYFIIVTIIAIFVGLIWGNIFTPGTGLSLKKFNATDAINKAGSTSTVSLAKLITNTIPETIFVAGYNNSSLQITFAAVMFAVSMLLMPDLEAKDTLVKFFDAVLKAVFK